MVLWKYFRFYLLYVIKVIEIEDFCDLEQCDVKITAIQSTANSC